jgi:hypothetical protein
MNKLLRDDDKETTNPNEIRQMQKTFHNYTQTGPQKV